MEVWGPIEMDMAAGTKNSADGMLSTCVVDGMIGRGHGRVCGPVAIWVSALYINLVGAEGVDEQHLPDITTHI
jgi:hypothetical protein